MIVLLLFVNRTDCTVLSLLFFPVIYPFLSLLFFYFLFLLPFPLPFPFLSFFLSPYFLFYISFLLQLLSFSLFFYFFFTFCINSPTDHAHPYPFRNFWGEHWLWTFFKFLLFFYSLNEDLFKRQSLVPTRFSRNQLFISRFQAQEHSVQKASKQNRLNYELLRKKQPHF